MNANGIFDSIWNFIQSIGLSDILDIAIVTLIFYSVLKLLRQTRAFPLLKGLGLFFGFYFLAIELQLSTLIFLISKLLQVGFIALVVLFQPELRRALEQVGSSQFLSKFINIRRHTQGNRQTDATVRAITALCDSIERMSDEHTGALIVMERFTSLESIKPTGTLVNGDITPELVGTIFYEGSPLHDGAMIIHEDRISYAGCVLPLSDNMQIGKDMGTRHRAALGISEISDAIAIVVSEETGIVSVATAGNLQRGYDRHSLYTVLYDEMVKPLIEADSEGNKKTLFRRLFDERK